MPTINLKDTLHGRLKKLALDLGITLGELVHQGCENAITLGEKQLEALRKKTASK